MNTNCVVNYFTGQTDDYSEVIAHCIPSANRKILGNYSKSMIKGRIKEDTTYDDFVNINSLNARKINDVMMKSIVSGTIAGLGLSVFINPVCVWKTVFGFGVVGGAIGMVYCVKSDLYNKEAQDNLIIKLEFKRRFDEFKAECTKEQYLLFTNFLKNYVQEEEFRKLREDADFNMFCGITFEIPSIPVFSPHDEQRRHVYERREIEKQIDTVDAQISRAILSECRPEYIEDLRKNYDPYRGPAFGKNELVMDVNFLKKSIVVIEDCLNFVLKNLDIKNDQLFQKGLTCLLNQYKSQYRQCTAGIINNLFVDLTKMGMDFTKSKEVCEEFQNNFNS